MIFREAIIDDIKQMQIVRNAVKENVLSNPELIKDADYIPFITSKGKGWVCEIDEQIVGFAIVDIKEKNIWALFVHPNFEAKGIGKQLHKIMMDWYFTKTKETIWLSTEPKSRAEIFYRMNGWKEVGTYGKGEVKFEMSYENWEHG